MVFAAVSIPAFANGDAEAGKEQFEDQCERCHYEDDYAEEPEAVIQAKIQAIVDGETRHRGDFSDLTEEEVANLAAYFASH